MLVRIIPGNEYTEDTSLSLPVEELIDVESSSVPSRSNFSGEVDIL